MVCGFKNRGEYDPVPSFIFMAQRNPGSAEAKLTVPENGLPRKWF